MSARVSAARQAVAAIVSLVAFVALTHMQAEATPIFAQRYGFKCTVCHSVIPELNSFGEHFRRSGFNIPDAPRKGYLPLVLRFQETYMKDLAPAQTRRFNALAILISTANFGRDQSFSYFARYFFGSQGAPGSLYYAYAQHVAPQTGVFERLGQSNLPLIANATQRLDTITPQPVYTYTVGHDSANFATPRLGVLLGRRNDRQDIEFAASFDEYHGAAYGAPTPPGDLIESFSRPELFASATLEVAHGVRAGVLGLSGDRLFRSRKTSLAFHDAYTREGVQASWTSRRFDLVAQQVWGHDTNADGFGDPQASSGGFVTLKYRPTEHAYVGVRYDAAANPFAARDLDFYAVFAPSIHARIVLEHVQPVGPAHGAQATNVQLLFAVPFEGRGASGPK
jgi:hypothetical protein